jgi:phospholipase C
VADQSSILRFIEDNWQLGQLGDQSFDAIAGSIQNLFDFSSPGNGHGYEGTLILDPDTGQVIGR